MSKWKSLEHVAEALELSSDPHDREAIKRELRMKLSEVHPDKTGGVFPSEEVKLAYGEISDAYSFVESARQNAGLISIEHLPLIIRAIREVDFQVEPLRNQYLEESREQIRRRNFLPRIGSGVFAAISTSLFTFSGSLKEHPFLGEMSKNHSFQICLLFVAMYSGLFFVMTWIRERREEEASIELTSDFARRKIFSKLALKLKKTSKAIFSIEDVIEEVDGEVTESKYRHGLFSVMFGGRVSGMSLREKIAKIHIIELEKRGVILGVKEASIEPRYHFSAEFNLDQFQCD